MSMPNIPDIKPEINITLEDAVNLLLTSIAQEEISLAGLMDAEKNKISCVLNNCKSNKTEIGDILSVNDSVNQTIINLIKMQMLLQFKLDSVKTLIPPIEKPCKPPEKPCPPIKPCPPEKPCRPPICCPCGECRKLWCLLIGKSRGVVSNQSDDFYCCKAVLCAFVSSRERKDNIITYNVSNNCESICMTACGNNIKFECPRGEKCDKIELCGKGTLIRIFKCKKTVININFELTVWDNKAEKNGFHIIIEDENQNLIHESGFIESCSCGKGLELCCYEK